MASLTVLILWAMCTVPDNTEITNPLCAGLTKSSRRFIGLTGFVTPGLATISRVSFVHGLTSELTKRSEFLRGFHLGLVGERI